MEAKDTQAKASNAADRDNKGNRVDNIDRVNRVSKVLNVSNDNHTQHTKHGWEVKKLGEVATILNGYAFDSKLFSEDSNDVPLIRIRDIKRGYTETFYKGDFSEEYIIRKGDYLIGMDGEFNIAEWKGENALLNQRVCKIIANKIVDRYLFWYMPIVLKQIEDATPFVTVKHLSSKQLINTTIPIPPREEQERIVEELDCLSGVIERKREQLKQLDALAQSIFYDMFGDPISNEKGFPVYKIDDIITFQGGSQPDKSHFEYEPTDDNIRLIQIRDYKSDKNITYIPKSLARRLCNAEDIMIGRYGPPIFQILKGIEGAYNVALMKAIPKQGNREFIRAFLKQKCLLEYLESMSKRTAGQDGIQMDKLKAYPFPLPPIELQDEFADKIEAIEKQKELLKRSIKEVETLFDARMDYYFGDT